MKKRNLVLLGSAAALALAIGGSVGAVVTASAATEITNGSGGATTTVTYSQDNEWKVTVPESLTVGGAPGEVKAEGVKIEQGTTLDVTVSSENGWKVQDSEGHSIDYELKSTGGDSSDTALEDGGTVLSVTAGNEGGSANLTATLKEGSENYSTGSDPYTDTLTFSVSAK